MRSVNFKVSSGSFYINVPVNVYVIGRILLIFKCCMLTLGKVSLTYLSINRHIITSNSSSQSDSVITVSCHLAGIVRGLQLSIAWMMWTSIGLEDILLKI